MNKQENDAQAERINSALAGSENQMDAMNRLGELGFDRRTSSMYAAHHFGTFKGDVVNRDEEE